MRYLFLFFFFSLFWVSPIFAEQTDSASPEISLEFSDPFDNAPVASELADPLEPVNRASFWVNDKLYTHLLKPICESMPAELRTRVAGWLANLEAPLELGPAKLEFKFRDAGSEVGRFLLHGLVGLISNLDPSKTTALAGDREDFGAVFEAFGAGPGIYVVLPVLGPSSFREGIGQIAGIYLEPSPDLLNTGGGPGEVERETDLLGILKSYENLRESTIDPYLAVRDAYAQMHLAAGKDETISGAVPSSYRLIAQF